MFYGEKLYEIREMFSYTRKDLANKLQLSEYFLWQIETNQIVPGFMTVNRLKNFFHVQASFFFKKSFLEKTVQTNQVAYREQLKVSRNNVEWERRFLDFFLTHLKRLEEIVYPDPGVIFSFYKEIEENYKLTKLSETDIKEIANKARRSFGIVDNKDLMYSLEIGGLYIVERTLQETVDAYSAWSADNFHPIIVLNDGKNSSVRRNFDMGHELGHLLLHRYIDFDHLDSKGLDKIEKEANLFASYLLLPEKEFALDFSKVNNLADPEEYILLKKKYRMSIQSMAYRAYRENWLTKEENRLFWRNINRNNYKKIEPLDRELPVYIPGKIRALLSKAMTAHEDLMNAWLDEYAVDIEYFEKIFGIKDDLLKERINKKRINYLPQEKILKLEDL